MEIRYLEFTVDPQEPVFGIGVASRLVGLPVWTLRTLDREQIVSPQRSEGQSRLYSKRDLMLLMRIRDLIEEEEVNLKGVRVILRLEGYIG